MPAMRHQIHWLVIIAMLFGPASALAQDLGITSSVSKQFPAISEPVDLTIVVSNPGSVTVRGIIVSNSLPDGLVMPIGLAPFEGQGNYSPESGLWFVGDLSAGQSATLVLPVTIRVGATADIFVSNTEIVGASVADPNPGNNRDVSSIMSSNPTASARLTLEVTSASAGAISLTVGVRVANHGPDSAENVVASLTVTANIGKLGEPGALELGTIASGESSNGELLQLFSCGQGAFTAEYTVTVQSDSVLLDDSVLTASGSVNGSGTGSCVFEYPAPYTKGCFIATASYGSYLHPKVQALRDFRDSHLLTNAAGRRFVKVYYRHSPPIAELIERHRTLQLVAQIILTPILYAVVYPYTSIAGVCGLLGVFFARRRLLRAVRRPYLESRSRKQA